MKLKPWYDVIKPREDLRESQSQDASEFAVHLDRVRDGTARDDYGKPDQFFEKTFLATNLLDLGVQTVRRLSGETAHTSPVFNLATNFGGGKTHALTLLYHLANSGPISHSWVGVSQIREKAAISEIPKARVAVFVGSEFDSLAGRGGEGGEPRRTTPWGEIAFQLGGEAAFKLVQEHDEKKIAPGGDVIRKLLPDDQPCLILMDELLNYASRFRSLGLNTQLYNFLFALSGALNPKSVLAVSVPASELEMTVDDISDFDRLTKMLDRVGKALTVTAGAETSEIIRRRLFEWDTRALTSEGKVLLPKDAENTCYEYARWINERPDRNLSTSIPPDHARSHFELSYPFHPTVLSVFERKWQTVPKFQQTRGILRLLALWIQEAYKAGYRKVHPDPLITLGTAPLGDPIFRAAVFEQLGSRKLETAVTVDIAGTKEAHAVMLDNEAIESIKKERLHQKVATVVFFESNGGTTKAEATEPEIRLAVGGPDSDLGNIETALDALTERCYYFTVEKKNYKFSLKENLNKRFTDKRANINRRQAEELVNQEIQKQFQSKEVERVFFPEKSIQISDRAVLTFVICDLGHTMEDAKSTLGWIDAMMRECGASGRTFKSALLWMVPESSQSMVDAAKKLLAWQAIDDDADELHLDDTQQRQLTQNIAKAERELKESVWRAYNRLVLLGKENKLRQIDLGRVNVSQATSIISMVLNRLEQDDEVLRSPVPGFLVRKWPPAFKEWSTRGVRDAFFASPEFPRLLDPAAAKDVIASGVSGGLIAYVGKTSNGYDPFVYQQGMASTDVEISNDVFIIKKDTAEEFLKTRKSAETKHKAAETESSMDDGQTVQSAANENDTGSEPQTDAPPHVAGDKVKTITWSGEVPAQKWSTFYNRVLAKFAVGQGLKLTVNVEVSPDDGISKQKIDETKISLRELGLNDRLITD
jgi:Protein of unknown function (DUF499)